MQELSEVSGLWSVRESGRVNLQIGDLRSEVWGEIDKSIYQRPNAFWALNQHKICVPLIEKNKMCWLLKKAFVILQPFRKGRFVGW